MEVICKCGEKNNYRTVIKGVQHTAYCNSCGAYIKNVGYTEPIFYVGKYKGMKISECNDKAYLQWFYDNVAKGRIKEAIKKRLSEL